MLLFPRLLRSLASLFPVAVRRCVALQFPLTVLKCLPTILYRLLALLLHHMISRAAVVVFPFPDQMKRIVCAGIGIRLADDERHLGISREFHNYLAIEEHLYWNDIINWQ